MAQATPVSPFAPAALAKLPPLDGVRFATAEAGIRYKARTDLMVAVLEPGTVAAGVLTQSKTCSAPVLACRDALAAGGKARMLVVNSGNANAFTGMKGREAVEVTITHAAKAVDCAPCEVYVASTGVIGEPMDATRFSHLLAGLAKDAKPAGFEAAARAIMTTDTYPKLATRAVRIGDTPVTINAFCKGAGMIAPDMATMLAFIFTDAAIAQPVLQHMIAAHTKTTFNCMTVDGDTSTSDTCLLFATGTAAKRGQTPVTDAADPRLSAFEVALHDLMRDLAIQIAKDGEGLSKFVTFEVSGAEDWAAARKIALACANSPILKTAIAGEDPELGPRRDGRRQVRRGRRQGPALDLVRRSHRRAQRRARRRVRREDGRRLHEEPRHRHPRRCRRRRRQGNGLDVRPDARLRVDQRRLSQLMP